MHNEDVDFIIEIAKRVEAECPNHFPEVFGWICTTLFSPGNKQAEISGEMKRLVDLMEKESHKASSTIYGPSRHKAPPKETDKTDTSTFTEDGNDLPD
jgi:hypothetical protein